MVKMKDKINKIQYAKEHDFTPINDGNFEEPLKSDKTAVTAIRNNKFLRI